MVSRKGVAEKKRNVVSVRGLRGSKLCRAFMICKNLNGKCDNNLIINAIIFVGSIKIRRSPRNIEHSPKILTVLPSNLFETVQSAVTRNYAMD